MSRFPAVARSSEYPRKVGPAFGRQPAAALAVLAGLTALLYLRWAPLVPDLAAQVARANVVHSSGLATWWTGWFGGLSLPNYSLLVPPSMAVLGVRVTGLVAVAGSAWATMLLTRDSLRPRACALAFAIAAAADLLDGRVTFASGLAVGAWSLVALRSRRPGWTVVLALTCYGASPLAGLFLGIVLVAVGITDRARRRLAVCAGSTVLLVAGSMAIIFPGTGTMPFAFADTVPPGLGCIAVLLVCRNSVIRWTTAIVLLSFPILLVYPGAIGGNITRFGWVCAAPIVIGYARLPRRALALTTLALMLWPLGDLAGQLTSSANPSAQAAYYAPLSSQLNRYLASGGSAGIGQRVELVDTKNHWGSVYLADLSLARGWDRQADVANNPIFYHSGALTAASYRAWLDSLAVALVAVPAAPLDYASIDEAALIGRGLDYLKPVWSSSTWKLYRVVDPTPLVSGATIRSVSSTGVVLTGPRDSPIAVRVRWSPYIVARDTTTGMATPACVSDVDGWVGLVLPRAETVTLSAKLDPKLRLTSPDPDCVADLLKG